MSFVGNQSLVRRRVAPGSRNSEGRWVDGVSTDTAFGGNVDPITGWALAALPESERSGYQIYVLTEEIDLRPATRGGEAADKIVWKGEVYEVISVMVYETVIPHTEARARRVSE